MNFEPGKLHAVEDPTADLLDELSDLCKVWAHHRDSKRIPRATRGAIAMICDEVHALCHPVGERARLSDEALASLRNRADAYDRLALAASRSPCFMVGDDWLGMVEQWMEGGPSRSVARTVDLDAMAENVAASARVVFSQGPFQTSDIIEWFKAAISVYGKTSLGIPQTSETNQSS